MTTIAFRRFSNALRIMPKGQALLASIIGRVK